MSQEPLTPVKEIVVTQKMALRKLLKLNQVLSDVEAGKRIVLFEGRNLSDLNEVLLSGKRIVIVSIGALGGG